MRLAFLIRSLANAHGVERTFIDKANFLAENGHSVVMITYEQGAHALAYPLSNMVKHVDLDCRYFLLYNLPFYKRYYNKNQLKKKFKKELLLFVEDFKPDVIVTVTYSMEFMREILSVRNLTRIIIESHSAFIYEYMKMSLFHKFQQQSYIRIIRKCDLLITLTKGDAVFWRKKHCKVVNIPNPISYYYEEVIPQLRQKGRIISVGRLYSPKRFDRLIASFSLIAEKYPEWFIDIFGDGEDREKLENMITRYNLTGRVNLRLHTDNIFEEYKRSQFLVVSSDHEGFSLVLIEAMACGIPVVSTCCPFGPLEIVEDGVSGLLSKLDVIDLSEKMEWMIIHEKERLEMGRNAYQNALRFKKDNVMEKWVKAYMSVIKN